MYRIFWKPAEQGGAAADFIPYFHGGVFHLFYLYDHRAPEKYGEGVSWYKIETRDFIHFIDKGEMIPKGKREENDLCAFTGSVIEKDGRFHIFYTGHNVYRTETAYQSECIMHAESCDLNHWEKIPEDTFFPPAEYDSGDFRDPFVYFDGDVYHMLLCVRKKGAGLLGGETLEMRSHDLKTWEQGECFYAPQGYHTLECPDLFCIDDWWYFIFSEYSGGNLTHYRMARTPNGPWIKPACDVFDGRAYYAAKTASDGEKRYLFGWIPTRSENKDSGAWMWGGNLAVHELYAREDGTLGVRLPASIRARFTEKESVPDKRLYHLYECGEAELSSALPETFLIRLKAVPHLKSCRFGIVLKENGETDKGLAFFFDPEKNEVYADMRPAFPAREFDSYHLRRPLSRCEEYKVELVGDDDIFVMYVNGEAALSLRLVNFKVKAASVFSEYADVDFREISIDGVSE